MSTYDQMRRLAPRAAWLLGLLLAGCGGGNDTYNPTVDGGGGAVPDFALTVSPVTHKALAEQVGSGLPGDPLPFVVTVRSVNGFASPVTLAADYTGPGRIPILRWSLPTVAPTAAGAQSTLSVGNDYDDKIQVGVYPITIRAVGGGLTRTVAARLVVTGYTVAITPQTQYLPPQGSVDYTVTLTPLPEADPLEGTVTVGSVGMLPTLSHALSASSVTFGHNAGPKSLTLTIASLGPQDYPYYSFMLVTSCGQFTVPAEATLTFQRPD
jgi:hypothetical protein